MSTKRKPFHKEKVSVGGMGDWFVVEFMGDMILILHAATDWFHFEKHQIRPHQSVFGNSISIILN